MKTSYCCNQKAFENYYVSQVGTGLPYFSGSQYQKGYGLGSIFSSLGRATLPLVRSTGKALGKEVLRTGGNIASDLLEGKSIKQAALHRSKQAGLNLLKRVASPSPPPGEPLKRFTSTKRRRKTIKTSRRTKSKPKDIFD